MLGLGLGSVHPRRDVLSPLGHQKFDQKGVTLALNPEPLALNLAPNPNPEPLTLKPEPLTLTLTLTQNPTP